MQIASQDQAAAVGKQTVLQRSLDLTLEVSNRRGFVAFLMLINFQQRVILEREKEALATELVESRSRIGQLCRSVEIAQAVRFTLTLIESI